MPLLKPFCYQHSVRFLLPALLLLFCAHRAAAQTLDDFYDDSVLQEIRLTMAPADWATLQANYTKSTRYPVVFQWRGIVVSNASLRVRGSGSRNPIKPGLGIEFDHYVEGQTLLGASQTYLKNLAEEPSLMTERLSMKLIRRLGLPTPREAHARVYLNDAYLGLFLLTESIDQPYVQRNLGESSGTTYSFNYVSPYHFEYLGDDPTLYTPEPFEASPEDDPHPELLVNMIRTINQASDADFLTAISQYFDPYLMMAHVAADNFIAEEDGIVSDNGMANFYLYRRDKPQSFQFLHWDKDYTLGGGDRSITWNLDTNVLTRRAMQVPALQSAYLDMLTDAALVAGGSDGWLHQEAQRVYDQIRQAALDDPNKQCGGQTCTNDAFEAAAQSVLNFTADRGPNVLAQVAALRASAATSFTIRPGSVRSAASGQPAIAPGALAALSTNGLPASGGAISVSVNGLPAPVVSVANGTVLFQVPWDAVPGAAYVQARVGDQSSNLLTVPMPATAPGIFSVTHADGRIISATSPATPGEVVVVYATGLGAVTPQPSVGAPASAIGALAYSATVSVGNSTVQPLFAGMIPGYIGLYQINVQLPGTLSGPLTLRVNDQPSSGAALTP